jgi:hypothetical protein
MNSLTGRQGHRARRALIALAAAVTMLAGFVLAAQSAEANEVHVYGSGATGISAVATNSSIKLAWSNPVPTKTKFTGMTIRREKGPTPTQLDTGGLLVANTNATTTNHTETGLSIDTEFAYSFFAHFSDGSIALTTFTASTLTLPISDVHATGSTPTSISLSWTTPSGANFTGTRIVRDDGATPPSNPNGNYDNEVSIGVVHTGTTHYTDIGLNAGTKYSYALFAEDAYGETDAATITLRSKAVHWSVSAPSVAWEIACPTTAFCAENDGVDGETWTGSAWTSPAQWEDPSNGGEVGLLGNVSCSSPTYCVGTNDLGDSTTWSGGHWSGAHNIDSDSGNGLGAISCVKNHEFCVALDQDGHEFTFHNGAWQAGQLIDPGADHSLNSISCVKETFCVAVDGAGHEITFDGTGWSTHSDGVPDAVAVSCSSITFCMIVGASSGSATYNGHVFKDAGDVVLDLTNDRATAVSCVSTSFCMTVSKEGYAFLYSGIPPEGGGGGGYGTWGDVGGWSSDTRVSHTSELQSVSCATTALCGVTGIDPSTGVAATYFGTP